MISVIVLSKNNGETLDKCLQSIIKSDGDKEIIVVDAHSTDNTPQILRKYRGKIKVVYDEGKGIGIARNIGVRHSRGDIICFVDADAFCSRNHFVKIKRFLDNNPEVGIVHVDYGMRCSAASSIVEKMEDMIKHSKEILVLEGNSSKIKLAVGCFIAFKRKVFDDVGGFWEFPPYGSDDDDFSLKALMKGWKIGVVKTNSWHSPRKTLRELLKEVWGLGKGKACLIKKWRDNPLMIKIYENRRSFKLFRRNLVVYSVAAYLLCPLAGLKYLAKTKSLSFYLFFILRQYAHVLGFIYGWFTWARRF